MPTRPPTPCANPRCPSVALSGSRWCAAHVPAARAEIAQVRSAHDARRGTAAARGYGHKWQEQSAVFKARFPLCYGMLVPTVTWNGARARELHALRLAAADAGTLAAFYAPGGVQAAFLAKAAIYTWHPRPAGYPALSAVVDHVVAHKGDWHLFWSEWNWQALDEQTHNRKTARHDRGAWSVKDRAAEAGAVGGIA